MITPISIENLSDEVREARHRLNRYSPGRIAEIADQGRFSQVVMRAGQTCVVEAVRFMPTRGDVDDDTVIVVNNPFCNGKRSLPQAMRALILQRTIGGGRHPLILFPENARKDYAYSLSSDDQALVRQGNFAPVAEQRAQTLDALYPHAEKVVFGYSLGASVGASLSRMVGTSHAVLVEAPNTEEGRMPRQLQKAFSAGGLGDLNRAVVASHMPALNELMGVGSTGRTSVQQLRSLAAFGLASLQVPNPAIKVGMSRNTFADDVNRIPAETNVSIARAEYSRIFTPDGFARVELGADRHFVLEGFGHGAGDCIPLLAELALQATANS